MGCIKHESWRKFNLMKKPALSPVIASIMLTAMVLVVGGGLWSYSKGAASMIASDYADNTIEMINTIQERFIIEHVNYDENTQTVNLWIYNYGDVPVIINSQISIDNTYYENNGISIDADSIVQVIFNIESSLSVNQDIIIFIYTNRGNSYREVYYVK